MSHDHSLARRARWLHSACAALAVAGGVAGCGTPEAARPEAQPSAAQLAAAVVAPRAAQPGTRWSTAELTGLAYAGRGLDEGAGRKLDALRAEYAPRAAAAGAELLWDLGGDNRLGDSPALYLDTGLALPAAGPVRVRTINLVQMADQHPRTREYQARLLAADEEVKQETARRDKALEALAAERTRQLQRGDKDAAAKTAERSATLEGERQAFVKENAAALQRRLAGHFRALRKELAAEAVATARAGGATVVLDVAAPLLTGEPTVIFVTAPLSPAAGGGLRAEAVPEAVVRTINREWLYENHPRSVAVHQQVRTEDQQASRELAPLKEEIAALEGVQRRQEQTGDKAGAEKTRMQLESARAAVRAREKTSRDMLGKRLSEHRKEILAEIATATGAVAQRAGVHLVLDDSGPESLGPRPVAYAAPALNLTEAVARELGIAGKP